MRKLLMKAAQMRQASPLFRQIWPQTQLFGKLKMMAGVNSPFGVLNCSQCCAICQNWEFLFPYKASFAQNFYFGKARK